MPWRLLRSAAPGEGRLGECGKRDEESSELVLARTAAKGRAEVEEGAKHGGRVGGNPANREYARNRMQMAARIQGTAEKGVWLGATRNLFQQTRVAATCLTPFSAGNWNCLRKELARKLKQKGDRNARSHIKARGQML